MHATQKRLICNYTTTSFKRLMISRYEWILSCEKSSTIKLNSCECILISYENICIISGQASTAKLRPKGDYSTGGYGEED